MLFQLDDYFPDVPRRRHSSSFSDSSTLTANSGDSAATCVASIDFSLDEEIIRVPNATACARGQLDYNPDNEHIPLLSNARWEYLPVDATQGNTRNLDLFLASHTKKILGLNYLHITNFVVMQLLWYYIRGVKTVNDTTIFNHLLFDRKILVQQYQSLRRLLDIVGHHCEKVALRGDVDDDYEFEWAFAASGCALPNVGKDAVIRLSR